MSSSLLKDKFFGGVQIIPPKASSAAADLFSSHERVANIVYEHGEALETVIFTLC